jgi:hypothetical protein
VNKEIKVKNNIVLSAVVAAGLMAGAVIAPAQAEEDLLPPGPCADFYTEFGSNVNSNLTDVKVDGAAWSGTLLATPEFLEQSYNLDLPYLKVEASDRPASGTCGDYPTPVNGEWVEKSDGWAASVYKVKSDGTSVDVTSNPSMYFTTFIQWLQLYPVLDVSDFGVYTNINNISVTSAPGIELEGYSGYKETQVSYTLTVLPPSSTGNQLPEVPNEPAGISDGYDFGNVEIFDYKRGVFDITNIGTDDLAVRKAKIVDSNGDEAPEFSVTGTTCKDGFIRPGRSCQVQVQFFPRVEGARAAFINVTSNSDYPLQIPLNGVGTYTEPESVVEADKESEANGTKPEYEVSEPEKPTVPNTGGNKPNGDHDGDGIVNKNDSDYVPDKGQDVTQKKNGTYVVKTKSKKINVKWKAPDTDQPVTKYEIRQKYKKKSWKKWKDVDPMPNKKGWIKASVKAKKPGNYKVQVASSTPWVERGDKATVKIKKK